MQTYTENVLLIQEHDKVIGFISRAKVYGCEAMSSEEIAHLIDQEFGVISRSIRREGEVEYMVKMKCRGLSGNDCTNLVTENNTHGLCNKCADFLLP